MSTVALEELNADQLRVVLALVLKHLGQEVGRNYKAEGAHEMFLRPIGQEGQRS